MSYRGRRNKNIFTMKHKHRPASAIKAIVFVVALAVIIFLSYCIYDPIAKLVKGEFVSKASSSVASSSSSNKVSSKNESSAPAVSNSAKIHGVYLPKNYLSDTGALNTFIASAKDAKINLAVIDLKAEDGIINYNTSISKVKGTEAVIKNAPDAAAAAKALSDAGITPAARICAFKDPVAPTILRGAGVMYSGNHSINWLDPQNSRWLNPNSPDAQQYITDIVSEAVSMGYKQIFIDGLTFPTASNADKQGYYGDNMASKEEVLTNFVSALKTKVAASGAKLTVATSGLQALGQAQENIGQSTNIFDYSADYVAPNLSPSLLGLNVSVGGQVIAKPDTDPAAAVTAAANYLKSKNADKIGNALPFIQAYTNSSIGAGNYKTYSDDDIKNEIKALQSAGIESYILYNPKGTYNLSALK